MAESKGDIDLVAMVSGYGEEHSMLKCQIHVQVWAPSAMNADDFGTVCQCCRSTVPDKHVIEVPNFFIKVRYRGLYSLLSVAIHFVSLSHCALHRLYVIWWQGELLSSRPNTRASVRTRTSRQAVKRYSRHIWELLPQRCLSVDVSPDDV